MLFNFHVICIMKHVPLSRFSIIHYYHTHIKPSAEECLIPAKRWSYSLHRLMNFSVCSSVPADNKIWIPFIGFFVSEQNDIHTFLFNIWTTHIQIQKCRWIRTRLRLNKLGITYIGRLSFVVFQPFFLAYIFGITLQLL